MDIGLPGMDGYQVARRLRGLEATRTVMLIALTGYGQPEDTAKALRAGFDLHLVKPVDLDALADIRGAAGPARTLVTGTIVGIATRRYGAAPGFSGASQ